MKYIPLRVPLLTFSETTGRQRVRLGESFEWRLPLDQYVLLQGAEHAVITASWHMLVDRTPFSVIDSDLR